MKQRERKCRGPRPAERSGAGREMAIGTADCAGRGTQTKRNRRAFSLLEIILALAILSGAIVVLSQLVRLGLRNAEAARDLTKAQLLCESKLAEITSGVMPAEAVSDAACETDPEWHYSVQLNPTEQTGLLALEVTVYRPTLQQTGPQFRLVRWMQDPAFTPAEEVTAEEPTAE